MVQEERIFDETGNERPQLSVTNPSEDVVSGGFEDNVPLFEAAYPDGLVTADEAFHNAGFLLVHFKEMRDMLVKAP